jgi:hypothetical protein
MTSAHFLGRKEGGQAIDRVSILHIDMNVKLCNNHATADPLKPRFEGSGAVLAGRSRSRLRMCSAILNICNLA